MRGLRVERFGQPPVVVDGLPRPSAAPGGTVVRMVAVALGHLDRSVASGTFPTVLTPPYIPCGEGSGYVVESGTFPAGALVWIRGAGAGVGRDGVAAEYAWVPDPAVHPAPEGADELLAACFFSPATAAHVAVGELGGVGAGDRVLVSGAAGSAGSLAVQLALAAGAEVTALVSRPGRAALVPPGARIVVAGHRENGPPTAPGGTSPAHPPGIAPSSRLDGEAAFDVLVDTVGGPDLNARLDAVRPGGRAVLLGYTQGRRVELDLPARLAHDVDLRFVNMQRRAPQAFAVAGELLLRLSKGELTLALDRYPLDRVADAWQALAGGTAAGRVVLTP
ncbi:quinone oxidoreductase family protein [Nonomuraea sp. LPB2021202275-12-8]|uniref:quinone oxidoreductase family protein n=1 Tax=Nonomuraea sp. LPB2021202275-12-8 TaxID=3120159 RepID=UPI00300CB8CD